MEKDLEHLLSALFANKVTDTEDLRSKLQGFLHPEFATPKLSSFLVLRCINSENGLLQYLETAIAHKDSLTRDIKKVVVNFLANMTRAKPEYVKNYLAVLMVH
jgi:hypothetical protein